MIGKEIRLSRRRLLTTAAQASALLAIPQFIPSSALGKDGAIAPSERIAVGCIGIGNRGSYDLTCFLGEADAQVMAVCDVRGVNRDRAKRTIDAKYGNTDCKTYIDLREILAREDLDAVLIATGPNWHCTASCLAANAGKDVYSEKPSTKNIAQSLMLKEVFARTARVFQAGTQRRSLPNFIFSIDLARRGKLGKLHTLHAHPGGLGCSMSGWLSPDPEPAREEADWDQYLGPAAWRPFNKSLLNGFNFEKGGGLTGGGCLEWGSHCVDLCQWANDADSTAPIEYEPVNGQLHAVYANGVKLILRNDGWLPLGSCPVKFEGDAGWVETGDDGDVKGEPASLLAGRRVKIGGYPANFHVRNFLDCVKSRGKTRANAEAACWAHIACHAANVALFLQRKVKFDPIKCEFIADAEANRLRSEALREPWRL
ncbi:MAG: Gfo/Idh/MocA family oxidoreductase [Tepidisphaeraceae bacterium]|jgi:hypothetical protein